SDRDGDGAARRRHRVCATAISLERDRRRALRRERFPRRGASDGERGDRRKLVDAAEAAAARCDVSMADRSAARRRSPQVANAFVFPTPSAPPAMFHIVDEAAWREIEDAKRLLPNNHLLAGVLYARAGLRDRAIEELRASPDPAASKLLREVQGW